ncbi:hypothetical protein HDV02_002015 [Globomyces sp. JEL0801]|nr:hypothetical protein HDV02_002015 [Globomyces sp. JEL0801]
MKVFTQALLLTLVMGANVEYLLEKRQVTILQQTTAASTRPTGVTYPSPQSNTAFSMTNSLAVSLFVIGLAFL